MKKIVGEENAIKILVPAMNRVLRQNSLDNIREWYEDTYLFRIFPARVLR